MKSLLFASFAFFAVKRFVPLSQRVLVALIGGGLRLGKRLAAHLGVDLLDLRREKLADILHDARLLEDDFPNRFDARFHLRRLGTPVFLHLFAQFDEETFLLAEQFAARDRSVSGANRFGPEPFRGGQRANPLLGVAVAIE